MLDTEFIMVNLNIAYVYRTRRLIKPVEGDQTIYMVE
jgi:hypothetical protein